MVLEEEVTVGGEDMAPQAADGAAAGKGLRWQAGDYLPDDDILWDAVAGLRGPPRGRVLIFTHSGWRIASVPF